MCVRGRIRARVRMSVRCRRPRWRRSSLGVWRWRPVSLLLRVVGWRGAILPLALSLRLRTWRWRTSKVTECCIPPRRGPRLCPTGFRGRCKFGHRVATIVCLSGKHDLETSGREPTSSSGERAPVCGSRAFTTACTKSSFSFGPTHLMPYAAMYSFRRLIGRLRSVGRDAEVTTVSGRSIERLTLQHPKAGQTHALYFIPADHLFRLPKAQLLEHRLRRRRGGRRRRRGGCVTPRHQRLAVGQAGRAVFVSAVPASMCSSPEQVELLSALSACWGQFPYTLALGFR